MPAKKIAYDMQLFMHLRNQGKDPGQLANRCTCPDCAEYTLPPKRWCRCLSCVEWWQAARIVRPLD